MCLADEIENVLISWVDVHEPFQGCIIVFILHLFLAMLKLLSVALVKFLECSDVFGRGVPQRVFIVY